MRLAFIDFVYHYDAARPDSDEPLGGTTSAVCFLAREMAQKGTDCVFFNRRTDRTAAHGITALPLQALSDEIATASEGGGYDAYIFCGRWTRELVDLVRAHTSAPLIAWMHESVFAAPLTPALDAFDGVVFVSEWQQRVTQNTTQPRWKQAVIRNAMNPQVAKSFLVGQAIMPQKTQPPILQFVGSFARGAFHVPPLLEKIRAHRTDFSVEMFCNLDPSRNTTQDEKYIAWLRAQPNITHVGMVGQGKLARRMKAASVMVAPNPWPETSCIAMIEGLASGLSVVATNRAALPETSHGLARLVPVEHADDATKFDMAVDYDGFAAEILAVMDENPDDAETRLRQQVDYFHAHYQWKQRVVDWIRFIDGLKKEMENPVSAKG